MVAAQVFEQTLNLLQVVNDIYDTLKDTEKRAAYDAIMVRIAPAFCRCIKESMSSAGCPNFVSGGPSLKGSRL